MSTMRLINGSEPEGIFLIASSTPIGMGHGGNGACATASCTDLHCAQKNLTARLGLPKRCWVAPVLIG